MTPLDDPKIPSDPADFHTDEERSFANPWDLPEPDVTPPPPASSSIYPPPTSSSLPPASYHSHTAVAAAARPYTQPATKPKKKVAKVGVVLGIFIAVVTGGGSLLYGHFAERVSEVDLVQTSTTSTSFLRPKQWQEVQKQSDTHVMYGNMLGKDQKSTALVLVSSKPFGSVTVTDMSASEIDLLRKEVDKQVNDDYMRKSFVTPAACSEISNIKKSIDTTTTSTAIGIISIKLDCTRDNNTGTLTMKVLGGNDGNLHFVALIASASAWQKNQPVFEKMLDSVQPRGMVTRAPAVPTSL